MASQIYRHFDSEGNLLYIGVSLSALNRLQTHRDKADWRHDITKVVIKKFPDRESALKAEKLAIQKEHPRFNRTWNVARKKTTKVNCMALLQMAIENCAGNLSVLARRIGTSRQVVHIWTKRKSVPSWRMDALTVIAKDGRK